MVGFKETKTILEKWNLITHKLTGEDILEITSKLTSASNRRGRHTSYRKRSMDNWCDVLRQAFAKENNRLPKSRINQITGHKMNTIMQRLTYMGYEFKIQHEIHGNRAVTYYILIDKRSRGTDRAQEGLI